MTKIRGRLSDIQSFGGPQDLFTYWKVAIIFERSKKWWESGSALFVLKLLPLQGTLSKVVYQLVSHLRWQFKLLIRLKQWLWSTKDLNDATWSGATETVEDLHTSRILLTRSESIRWATKLLISHISKESQPPFSDSFKPFNALRLPWRTMHHVSQYWNFMTSFLIGKQVTYC